MALLRRHRNILIFLLLSLLMHGAGLFVLNRSRTTSWDEKEGAQVIRVEMVRATQNSPDETAALAPSASPTSKKPAAPTHPEPQRTESAIPSPGPSASEEHSFAAIPVAKPPANPPETLRTHTPPTPSPGRSARAPHSAAAGGASAADKAEPPSLRKVPQPSSEAEEAVRVAKPPPVAKPAPVTFPKDPADSEPVEETEPELGETAPLSAARSQASALSSAQQSHLLADYQRRVRALIARQKRYPLMARRRQLEGEVLVGFAINPDGSLADSAVVRSSGAPILDRAALEAVRNAGRFPPPPSFTGAARRLPVEVPIDFRLR